MLACASLAQTNMGQVQTSPLHHPHPQCLWKSCLECPCAPKVTKPGHWRAAAWLILHQFAQKNKSAHNMCSSVPVGKCCRSAPGVLQE